MAANTDTGSDQEKIRKTEEKKDKEKEKEKPKTVYTDEDLKKIKKESVTITEVSSDPNETTDTGKTQTTNQPDPQKKDAKAIDPKQTEKYWRDKKAAIEKNIEDNKEVIRKEEENLARLQLEFNNASEMAIQQQQIGAKIQEARSKIANYKRGIQTLKKELEALQEEARREGALPGWVRDNDD